MSSLPENVPPGAWAAFRQSVTHFDRAKMNPWLGLRNAVGVALPLVAGLALHSISGGVSAALGAFNVAFRDSDAPYVQRARHMLLASFLVGVAVFAGSLSGRYHVLAVIVVGLWALVAGLLVAVSGPASELGVMCLVLVIIYAAAPQDPGRAALSGLYAFAGGVLQTLISLAPWPLDRYLPERRALAGLLGELARTAVSAPHQADDAPAATAESIQAQVSLATLDGDRSIESERYRFLLSQAERIRLTLLALRRLRARALRERPAIPSVEILTQFLEECSRLLTLIASALEARDAIPPSAEAAPALDVLLENDAVMNRFPGPDAEAPSVQTILRDARFQMEALAGQLRAALDVASSTTPHGAAAFERREASKPWTLRLHGTLATLRANWNLQSAACRHAIRLAVCISLADALARGFGLRRSYWLPMTVALVLRSDFSGTFSRGVLRLLGTFAGLIFATALFHALPAGAWAPVLAIAALTFITRWAGSANYGLAVMAITAFVVLLLSLIGAAPREVMSARLINTAAGGVIALLAYWLWPTWERHQVAELLARMLDTFREYLRALRDATDRDRTRVAGRLARSNLEASIERVSAEPGVSLRRLALLSCILASTRRLARALLAMEAGIGQQAKPFPPTFGAFADQTELTLYYLAAALRGSPITSGVMPDLRAAQRALVHPPDFLNVEADRLTNSLNTLAEDVFRWQAGNTRGNAN